VALHERVSAPSIVLPPGSVEPVTVVVARFELVVATGLAVVLRDDRRVHVLERDLDEVALEEALVRWAPQVAVLAETAEPTFVERLFSMRPQTRVVVFAHDPSPAQGMRLLAAGANCVALSAPHVDVVGSVRSTARDERFFANASGERVERRYPADAEALTKREREVLRLLVKGASYPEVAYELEMGLRTAEKHAAQIFRKLGVRSKRDLVGMPLPLACKAGRGDSCVTV
jgi:DNA-binding NarL/FixJ family response regulator